MEVGVEERVKTMKTKRVDKILKKNEILGNAKERVKTIRTTHRRGQNKVTVKWFEGND